MHADGKPPRVPRHEQRGPHHAPQHLAPKPQDATLCDPTPAREVDQRQPQHDAERAAVGGVPDEGVWPAGDEFVFGLDGEVEGEELPEGAVACESEEGAEYH